MIARILLSILLFLVGVQSGLAAESLDDNPNIRDVSIWGSTQENELLTDFYSPISEFFYTPSGSTGKDGLLEAFTVIAFNIKNIIIVLAVIFLILAVVKLIFSPNDEESVKKWRSSIIWVSVGIFVMQFAFSVWRTLLIEDAWQGIDSKLGWAIWLEIFSPIVGIIQLFASFGFLLMVVYAFYTIVGGAGDEEKLKKWKMTIIYGLVGFFLIRFPEPIIKALYGSPNCRDRWILNIGSCEIANQNISGAVGIVGKIIVYINWFLMLVCVILVIYAGWLVLISGGDEEKLKKAKSTILYVFIGFIVLIASHTIFRFFILQG